MRPNLSFLLAASNALWSAEVEEAVSERRKQLVLPRHARCVLSRLRCNGHSLLSGFYLSRQRRSSRPPNPQLGGPRSTLGAQVSLKLLFGYVTIFSSADLFTTDLNCRKKLACDIISECNVILSRRI